METIRLVNTYGDVAYGKAQQQPLQKKSGTKGLTEGSGRTGNSRTPGTYGPSVNAAGGGKKVTPPKIVSPKNSSKALADAQKANVAQAEAALKKMVGWSTANKNARIQYKVAKSGLSAVLYVKGPQDSGFALLPKTDTRWLATVAAAERAYAAEKGKKPQMNLGTGKSAGTPSGTTSETPSGTTSETPSGTSDTPTDTGGSSGGASTPAWFTQPYLNDMLAISGWTGPSYNMPGVTLTVKSVTLDGVSAPAIGVTSSTGAVDVTPAMAEWSGYASNVVASKAEDDQRKASGTPAPSSSGGGSSARVTSETTSSGYSVWSSDSVPSSDSAPAPASSGGGGSSMRVVEDAPAFAPSGEAETAPEAVTLVSEEGATAEGEEGFLAKNKWYVAGGAVALLGGYAYMHRMNPTKYPLPDYLSKLVRG